MTFFHPSFYGLAKFFSVLQNESCQTKILYLLRILRDGQQNDWTYQNLSLLFVMPKFGLACFFLPSNNKSLCLPKHPVSPNLHFLTNW